ncbi:hypothetical protein HH212_07375 [Massilia forsythiae]|uniref:Prepilin type IV endopeptidase peptidase domain-containing protein n=1 Tax=Massilia forsythiae TaxID=2728020 RepID=A0A7Z2VVC0_9BURK|nr:prepilin peptidase [Massilia forsythiae]QJD99863.1 hypothetical protein HH212_07375 [Massilia forsythiae]
MPIEQYLDVVLLLLVSAAAINDLATRRIPNLLLLAGLSSAFILYCLSVAPGTSLLSALGGMATGLGLFLPFYIMRGMAAGDVKMMMTIGAFSGPDEALEIAILSWCIGGVMALAMVLWRGRLWLALRNIKQILYGVLTPGVDAAAVAPQTSAGAIPYGLAMAIGTIIVLLDHHG